MSGFMDIMRFRHACKIFDENRRISKEDFDIILEGGRLSPSSFGLEPWHFLVVENAQIKQLLRAVCWEQPQVTTCSHFMILLSKKSKFFAKDSEYLNDAFKRKAKDENILETIKQVFDNFIAKDLATDVRNWAKMQVYIAGANMMNTAASLGIDSCAMEGFNAEALTKTLIDNVPSFDKDSYNVVFAIAFGYRVEEPKDKIRWPLDNIATFVR